ncbi:MAG TPA: ABC transporter permease [Tepidisphaeraceae bacterium]|jgi:Cu-processing system permease protein
MIAPATREFRFADGAAARRHAVFVSTSPREPWISPRTVLSLARKELRDSLRNRWFVTYTAAFAVLAIGLAYLSRVGTAMSGFAGFGATAASLVNLVLLIVPLMALTIGAASIAPERERGTLAYLLAQPIGRTELFLAKFVGLAGALVGSLAVGFGLSALTLARGADPRQVRLFLTLVVLAMLLALAMLSVGMLISVLARRSAAATGAAIMAWLVIVFVGDLGLMGSAVLFRLRASSLLLASLANPAQCFKIAVIGSYDPTLDLLGPAGLYASNTFGATGLPVVLIGCLAAWVVLPLVLAAACFGRRPL